MSRSRTSNEAAVQPGRVVVLTAPSGSGKTTLARHVLAAFPAMRFSVSATTRAPRPDEIDGVHYHFLSPAEFQACIDGGDFLEFEQVYEGKYYGTLRKHVDRLLTDHPVLFDVDVEGALSIKRHYGDRALTLFVYPPSLDVLAERLRTRETETPDTIAERLRRAAHELGYADRFDAVVLNDDLDVAVQETLSRVKSFLSVPNDQSIGPDDPLAPPPDEA